ncbi:ATP-binding protein [Mediterraneibacter glycyrrhizinilyticus]|uniref:ATP-binding protein n=1 Tax=Mediterraneibacter glycyrrhizinilyticus TaxID=342942 RepID=UPI0025A4279F|nr:zonular occludens toxin domain-containing protein [Mediterraneibacter glycyrrhizinilyticus]MDM8126231.1 zonular occludens toxin domain-containing protein [Mediterraneibacter glycyrrhizinilyticus]
MIDEKCCKEKFKPLSKFFKYLKYKFKFAKENPNYFFADGLVVFVGPQGSGKTLSAVNYIYNLLEKYPKAKLVTNVELKDYKIITFTDYIRENKETYSKLKEELKEKTDAVFYEMYLKNNKVFKFENNDDFAKYNNNKEGVIFFVDEIQLYLNSLQSKNINMDVIVQISQQRKQRKHIVATSQIFGRMAKPLREQFSNVILCKNILGFIQYNKLIDRDSISEEESTNGTELKGTVKKKFLFVLSPDYFNRYDTYSIIKNNKFTAGENQKDIYTENEIIKIEQKGDEKNDKHRKSK